MDGMYLCTVRTRVERVPPIGFELDPGHRILFIFGSPRHEKEKNKNEI